MINKKKLLSAAALLTAFAVVLSGCKKKDDETTEETSETTSVSETLTLGASEDDELFETFYTGQVVENEEDLAIFKFNADIPEGYITAVDDATGKQYISEIAGIVVKAQNFKEEFQDLEVFADQGCAAIKINNMLYQSDTDFSDPIKTTVGGFDAIRYDYTVTSYFSVYETDAEGAPVIGEDGKPIFTGEKKLNGIYKNRVYYFYSDEDVFYIICEASEENAEAASAGFDSFIDSVTISKK